MRDDQIDRALNIFERFVKTREIELASGLEIAARRDARDERAVAAQELAAKSAGSISVKGEIEGNVQNRVSYEAVLSESEGSNG